MIRRFDRDQHPSYVDPNANLNNVQPKLKPESATSYGNAKIEEINYRAASFKTRIKPFEEEPSNPVQTSDPLEQIRNIPIPDPRDQAAHTEYIRQTQVIAKTYIENSVPPKLEDFTGSGLNRATANYEYSEALSGYNRQISQLKPYAEGISYVRYDKTVEYMFNEMKNNLNTKEFKDIKSLLDLAGNPPPFSGPNSSLGYLTAAGLKFREQVKADGPWDHKPKLREMFGLEEGVDAHFPIRGDTQHELFYDVWSNVHYGYVGSAAGFDATTLQKAADISEHGTGTNDPVDKVTVQIGIDLWNKHGSNLTKEQFEQEIQNRMPEIIAAQQTQEYKEKRPNFKHVMDISEGNGM